MSKHHEAEKIFKAIRAQDKECLTPSFVFRCVNCQDNNRRTALMVAAECGFDALVEKIIAAGGDIHAKNTYHKTALMYAAEKGRLNSAKLLMDAGADVNARNGYCTALTLAADGDHPNVVRLLRERGAKEFDDARIGCHSKYWSDYDGKLRDLEYTVKV